MEDIWGDDIDGAALLDEVRSWFGRFICVTDETDLDLLTLFTMSTYVAVELYTTPRIQLDSVMEGSGKTTVMEHLKRLAYKPIHIASTPTSALLPRLLNTSVRTVLLDEIHKTLKPDKPGVSELLAIVDSGYKYGATRPVLVPTKGGGWEAEEMSTFSPVVMAGNSPNLPNDTKSRSIRILLMPDTEGTVEDADWEALDADDGPATLLQAKIQDYANQMREHVRGLAVDLPDGCTGRMREKWRPLKRVAVIAGGRWPSAVDDLIVKDLEIAAIERELGLRTLPPGVVALRDMYTWWPRGESFVPTQRLVDLLIENNGEIWGKASDYGKALTANRLSRMVSQATKVLSQRPANSGLRGYSRASLELAWRRLGITKPPSESGRSGRSG